MDRLVSKRNAAVCALAIPWIGLQIYYARPFAEVVSGLMPQDEFIKRYVALGRDFQVLDSTLPKDAVLYCEGGRLPNFYSPRPVFLTLLDLHDARPIYRLTLKPKANSEPIDGKSILKCEEPFYRADRVVIETYRTPGKDPKMGSLQVQRCVIITNFDGIK